MAPAWKYDSGNSLYKPVERHSPGMVSVTYEPPTAETMVVVERLRNFRRPHSDNAPSADGAKTTTVPAKQQG